MSTELSIKRRFLNLRTFISFALGLAFILFLLLRLDVDMRATYERIRSAHPLLYLLAFVVYYASFPLRAWRWHLLLENAGERQLPSAWRLTPIMLINWSANTVVYARLGDAYRAYLLREESGASFTRAVGTVVAERMMDLAVVVGLMMVALTGAWRGGAGALPFLGIGLLALLGLFLLLMARLGPWLAQKLPARLSHILASFRQGVLGSFRRLPLIALLSVAIWLLETGRFFLVAAALDLQVSPMLLLFTAQAIALLVALPLTPGGIGIVEPGVAGILMLVLSREEAWSVAILDRTISYLSLIAVGLVILLLREVLRLRAASRAREENR
ncbi:MAG: lysylphosphatidylglycerol synthase transmembrane domain-containing protein [Chloroflexota bacterium]